MKVKAWAVLGENAQKARLLKDFPRIREME